MMEVLRAQLLATEEGVELVAFFESCPSRSAMICALLAVLELVRLQAIVLTQTEIFGAIASVSIRCSTWSLPAANSATVRTPHSIDASAESGESNATAAAGNAADENRSRRSADEIVNRRSA